MECGISIDNILNLQCNNVDINRCTITFNNYDFSIKSKTAKMINQYINYYRRGGDDPIFISSHGSAINSNIISVYFYGFRKKSGSNITFTDLRNFYIYNQKKNGVSANDISGRLGYSLTKSNNIFKRLPE